MKLVHFTKHDGSGPISFVADKIICVTECSFDENKTSIFVLSAGGDEGNDEFVVGDNYRQVVTHLEMV